MDPHYIFTNIPIQIHGAFFFGSKSTINEYSIQYHLCLNEFHSENIADDDQSIILCVYTKEKLLFKLWNNNIRNSMNQISLYVFFYVFNMYFIEENIIQTFLNENLS